MKNFCRKNFKKVIAIIMLIMVTVLALFAMPKNAAEINRCKINVIDDASKQEVKNDDVKITQKIVEQDDKEITIQVDFENYQFEKTQIAIAVDNSYSMWCKAEAKSKLVELVTSLFENIENIEVSLVTNDGIKIQMGTDKDQIISQINNLTEYTGITRSTPFEYAKQTLTKANASNYVIFYTDGQEKITDQLQDLKDNNIKLITAYLGTDKTLYKQYSIAGDVFTVEDLTDQALSNLNTNIENKIKTKMVKEIRNINIVNTFSSEINNNFQFELDGSPNAGNVIVNNNGYTWTISNLNKKDTAQFKYKLKLNNNIDRTIMYKDIGTNSNMSITYQDSETSQNVELQSSNTPIINIVETYTLKIKAINKKYTGVNAKDIEFKIEQIGADDVVVRTETLKTDENGEIILDDITQNGSYTFRITQISTPAEYELSDESKRVKTLVINKNFDANTIEGSTNDSDDIFEIQTNDSEKIVTAIIKMDPREFIINLNKIDGEYETPLDDVDFSLLEPEVPSIPKGTTVNASTSNGGKAVLTAEVAGSGSFTYKLSETSIPTGYFENEDEMDLNISFDQNGKPTNISSGSEYIKIDEENAIQEDTINVTVTNKMLEYILKIQAFNEKYKDIKIDGVKVLVTGTQGGSTIYQKEATTKNGIIELPINKYGQVTYTIKQLSAPVEYNLTQDVTYTITRDFNDNNLTLNSPLNDEDIILNNEEKILTVNIYLEQKTFKFKVNKIDKDETSKKLDGAKIKLNQPGSRAELEDTTKNGYIEFEADVVCSKDNKDDTYTSTYNIVESEKPTGYKKLTDSFGIDVTFDSTGKVINAQNSNTGTIEILKNSEEVELNLINEKQTYSLQLIAKHKIYQDVTIENVEFNVSGASGSNTFLQPQHLTTDEDGLTTKIENLKQDGILEFTIEETSVPVGYEKHTEKAYASYDFEKESLSMENSNTENIKVEIDNKLKLIKVTVYIVPKTFEIDISKTTPLLENTLIADASFAIEQPNIGTVKRNNVSNITIENSILKLYPEVAGEGGPYEYIVKEIDPPEGYENKGLELKLNIKFDSNGDISEFTSEEIQNTKLANKVDESNDYISTEVKKDLIKVGQKTKNDGKDVIPLTIENDLEKPKVLVTVRNSKYDRVKVPNTEVKIVGQTSEGEFYTKTLKTDSEGCIHIAGIDNTGDFDFKAIATKVPAGYLVQKTETIAYVNKDVVTTELTERTDEQNVEVEGNTIYINLYLELKTFSFEISKYEEKLNDLLIPNVRFTLTQPDISEEIKREEVRATTKRGEKLLLVGEVAGEGEYQYTVKELAPSGYIDNNIEFTVNITFDSQGNITKVEKNDDQKTVNCNSFVTFDNTFENNKIPVTIMNYQKDYSITVELTNTNYRDIHRQEIFIKGIKIENAKIKVIGTTEDGTKIYESPEVLTDSDGKFTFEPLKQRGTVIYTVKVLEVPTGYIAPIEKTFKINKDEVTTEIVLIDDPGDISIDNGQKNIHVNIFPDVQKFNIKINKKDKDENDLLVEGATFTVDQPNFADVQRADRDRKNLAGTTELNKPLIIEAEVGGENNPYIYKLKEDVPKGFMADNTEHELQVEFNHDGTIKNVTCSSEAKDAYVNTSQSTNNTVVLDVINTKKPYTINVIASNSEHTGRKVEGLKLKIIGKDKQGQIVFESDILTTNAQGNVSVPDLKTTGDVTYEIQQLPDAPAAYYLGSTTYVPLNINKQNNVITYVGEANNNISVNDSSKIVTVRIFNDPKKFDINLTKLDYDDKLNDIDTLIGGANFTLTNSHGEKSSDVTVENQVLVMKAEVGGEGTYNYELWETWPTGYQEFYAKVFLTVTFDKDGNIIEQTIQSEESEPIEPVVMNYEWWTWGIDSEGNFETHKTENNKGIIELTGYTKKSVSLFVTNVKKEYSYVIRTIDAKYDEPVDDVYLQVKAYDGTGKVIYNQILRSENGSVRIPEFRTIGRVRLTIQEVSVPTRYKDFTDKQITINKLFPEITAQIDEANTSSELNVEVVYPDFTEAKGPINSPTTIVGTIMLERKTFDINLDKVDIDNEKLLLPGATFRLQQSDNKHSQTEKTDENGELKLEADIEGIEQTALDNEREYLYLITEENSPRGYQKPTFPIQLYVTLNKKDEVTNVRIVSGSSFVSEIRANRTTKSIDLLAKNAKGGNIYNLKLIKKYDDKEVKGSTYKININAESGENLTVKDITNKDGEIDVTKIPGNEKIVFKLTEIEPAPGFNLDTKERTVTVRRDSYTGDIEIIDEETSDDLIVTYDKTTNTIIVELNTPAPKEIKNLLKIISVDKYNETKTVAFATVQIILPEGEGVLEETTDKSGYITLDNITPPGVGTYQYTLKVTKTPKGYLDYQGGDINVNITFNENGNITATELANPNTDADANYECKEDDNNIYNIANIIEKNIPAETIDLNILKKGENGELLKDVEFDITTITTIDGVETISSTSSPVKTNEEGMLTYKVLVGDKIEIILKEVKTDENYKLDSNPKSIVLQKINGKLQLIEEQSSADIQIELVEDVLNVTIINKFKPARVIMQFINEDDNNNAIKLRGIKVKVKELNSQMEYELTTDEAGEINFNDLPVQSEGTYEFVITEMTNINGYEVYELSQQDPIKIVVQYTKDDTGKLEVNDVTYESPNNIVQGVSYTNYTAPDEYRVFLRVVLAEQIAEDAKFNINVYKMDKEQKAIGNDVYLEGANFDVIVDYLNNTGLSINSTTNEDGIITFTVPFVPGDMQVNLQELTAPEGYNIDDDAKKEILLNKDSKGNVSISENILSDSMYTTFDNKQLNVFVLDTKQKDEQPDEDEDPDEDVYEYEIQIQKIDKDTQEAMEEVEFTIVQINEETGEEIGNPSTIKTDEEGKIKVTISDVKENNTYVYKIVETTPNGYKDIGDIKLKVEIGEGGTINKAELLEENGAVKEVDINEDIVKLLIENEKEDLEDREYEFYMELDKIDKDTEEVMPDVEFTITEIDEDQNELEDKTATVVTNENGQVMLKFSKIKANSEHIYVIKETKIDGYKQIKDIKIKVYIGKDGKAEKAEILEENEAIKELKVENNIVSLLVQNEKVDSEDAKYKFYLEIDKIEKESGKVMPDVEFTITEIDEDQNELEDKTATATTNEEGKLMLMFSNIKANSEHIYVIKETKIDGYKQIKDIKIKVYIDEDGKVEKIELLEENIAVKELKIEDGIIKLLIENEIDDLDDDPNDDDPVDDDPVDDDPVDDDPVDDDPVGDDPVGDDPNDNDPDINDPNKNGSDSNDDNSSDDSSENGKKDPNNDGFDNTLSSKVKEAIKKLPYSGASSIIVILLTSSIVIACISYKKYKKE